MADLTGMSGQFMTFLADAYCGPAPCAIAHVITCQRLTAATCGYPADATRSLESYGPCRRDHHDRRPYASDRDTDDLNLLIEDGRGGTEHVLGSCSDWSVDSPAMRLSSATLISPIILVPISAVAVNRTAGHVAAVDDGLWTGPRWRAMVHRRVAALADDAAGKHVPDRTDRACSHQCGVR